MTIHIFCRNVIDNCIFIFYIQKYLPEAPVEGEDSNGDKEKEGKEKAEDSKLTPSLQFSHVECALFALHSLCRKAPESLSADTAKLKALRLRLQYTARLTQGYIKKLKEVTKVITISQIKAKCCNNWREITTWGHKITDNSIFI